MVLCFLYYSHWFGAQILSRTPSARFSRKSKPDIRSSGFTVSYLLEMFFLLWEKCCYFQIFPNEVTVLIESFEKSFKATPFCNIFYRWHILTLFVDSHYSTCSQIQLIFEQFPNGIIFTEGVIFSVLFLLRVQICQKLQNSHDTPPIILRKSRPEN